MIKKAKGRSLLLIVARVCFVAGAVIFGFWALRNDWQGVMEALSQISVLQWLASLVVIMVGLLLTSIVWIGTMRHYGYLLPAKEAASIFFVGQIGKYIPGSVWSLAAQGQMSRQFGVPIRVAVATGIVFVYWNVTTAALTGASLAVGIDLVPTVPVALVIAVILVSLVGMTPAVIAWLSQRLAGTALPDPVTWIRVLVTVLILACVWLLYGVALLVLLPEGLPSLDARFLLIFTGAFAISYLLGVLVPLAPAGFGVRETVLIGLLAPSLGLATATALTLLTRVLHTAADFMLAAMAWFIAVNERRTLDA